eukprot:TRINITY_DN619_c0_g1_i1.p1 TRINITY_DN619_c0_g1~~TRINITY_DN619_c0_g1_i1.p1  ORF type:complete len:206 (+),score=42.47 TRINITY_DN619_c0_g1_i1:125-742(+)
MGILSYRPKKLNRIALVLLLVCGIAQANVSSNCIQAARSLALLKEAAKSHPFDEIQRYADDAKTFSKKIDDMREACRPFQQSLQQTSSVREHISSGEKVLSDAQKLITLMTDGIPVWKGYPEDIATHLIKEFRARIREKTYKYYTYLTLALNTIYSRSEKRECQRHFEHLVETSERISDRSVGPFVATLGVCLEICEGIPLKKNP